MSQRKPRSAKLRAYDGRIGALHAAERPEEERRKEELRAMAELSLDGGLDETTLTQLVHIQTDFAEAQQELEQQLERREMTPQQYGEALNGRFGMAMGRCRQLLGSDRFQMLFGEAGYNPEGLVQADLMPPQG